LFLGRFIIIHVKYMGDKIFKYSNNIKILFILDFINLSLLFIFFPSLNSLLFVLVYCLVSNVSLKSYLISFFLMTLTPIILPINLFCTYFLHQICILQLLIFFSFSHHWIMLSFTFFWMKYFAILFMLS